MFRVDLHFLIIISQDSLQYIPRQLSLWVVTIVFVGVASGPKSQTEVRCLSPCSQCVHGCGTHSDGHTLKKVHIIIIFMNHLTNKWLKHICEILFYSRSPKIDCHCLQICLAMFVHYIRIKIAQCDIRSNALGHLNSSAYNFKTPNSSSYYYY